jgi:hypothetical protein
VWPIGLEVVAKDVESWPRLRPAVCQPSVIALHASFGLQWLLKG